MEKVRVLRPFVLGLTFKDGKYLEKNFETYVSKAPGILAKLADEKFFKKVKVNREKGTIEWPGEIDFCPESLAKSTPNYGSR